MIIGNSLTINSIAIERVLVRLASQIFELIHFNENLKIFAIQPRGIFVAEFLQQILVQKFKTTIEINTIDPTFFRDDIGINEKLIIPTNSQISLDFENQSILLIDDVIFTGRTTRATIDALLQVGRPKFIKTMVLVNRVEGREVPISVDYQGFKINLNPSRNIKIRSTENKKLSLVISDE